MNYETGMPHIFNQPQTINSLTTAQGHMCYASLPTTAEPLGFTPTHSITPNQTTYGKQHQTKTYTLSVSLDSMEAHLPAARVALNTSEICKLLITVIREEMFTQTIDTAVILV